MRGAASSQWIRSPAWDLFWMFSGLWAPALMALGCLAFWLSMGFTLPPAWKLQGELSFYYVFLGLGVLHRMSTTYAVLATPILGEGIRQDPKRYLVVPAAILVCCLALAQGFTFHSAFSFVSHPRGQLWAFFALVYVMVLWERWHFCMQEFGVLSIYRVRARQNSPGDRRFDRGYAIVVMLLVNMTLFACFGLGGERILLLGTFVGPPYDGETLRSVAWVAFVLGMAAMLVAVSREALRSDRSFPKIGFYVLVGSHTLVLYVAPVAYGLFFLANVFHHWMVAVGLFSLISFGSYHSPSKAAAARTFLARVGPFFAGCLAFYVVFGALDRAGNLLPLPDTSTFAGTSTPHRVGIGLVTGLFFAFNFLHYYYDRCLYSFSDPVVRRSVAPLLFGPEPVRR